MDVNSQEITDFINAVKIGVAKSCEPGKFDLISNIDFELAVAVKKEGSGKVNIAIVGAGGKYEKESITKIKFSMGSPTSYEQLQKMANIIVQNAQAGRENAEAFKAATQSLQS